MNGGLIYKDGPFFIPQLNGQREKGFKNMEKYTIKRMLNETLREQSKDFPLIDLHGKDEGERSNLVIQAMRSCIERVPLNITHESDVDGYHQFFSLYEYSEHSKFGVIVYHIAEPGFIKVSTSYGKTYFEKEAEMHRMLNLLNSRCFAWHYVLCPDTGIVSIESGMPVADCFSGQELFVLLRHLIGNACIHFPLINELLDSNDEPASILNRHDKELEAFRKENPELFG